MQTVYSIVPNKRGFFYAPVLILNFFYSNTLSLNFTGILRGLIAFPIRALRGSELDRAYMHAKACSQGRYTQSL